MGIFAVLIKPAQQESLAELPHMRLIGQVLITPWTYDHITQFRATRSKVRSWGTATLETKFTDILYHDHQITCFSENINSGKQGLYLPKWSVVSYWRSTIFETNLATTDHVIFNTITWLWPIFYHLSFYTHWKLKTSVFLMVSRTRRTRKTSDSGMK